MYPRQKYVKYFQLVFLTSDKRKEKEMGEWEVEGEMEGERGRKGARERDSERENSQAVRAATCIP